MPEWNIWGKINFHMCFLTVLIAEVQVICIFLLPLTQNHQLQVLHFCNPIRWPILYYKHSTFSPVNNYLTIQTVLLSLQHIYSNISLHKFFNLSNSPTYRPTQLSSLLLLLNRNYMTYHFNYFINNLNINISLISSYLSNEITIMFQLKCQFSHFCI